MVNNIELRREYVKLVQQGKPKDAFAKLQEIWRVESELRSNNKVNSIKKVEEVKKTPKIVKVVRFAKISDLSKIKGIGKETVKDIGMIFQTIDSLVSALNAGNDIPFRNDIVKKLKKELL